MDPVSFLSDLSSRNSGNRLRLGMARVRSVDSDGVFSITTGQAVILPSTVDVNTPIVANYLGEYPPRPGGAVWYATDGVDRIILGMMAPDGPPTASMSLTAATATTTGTNATVVMTTVDYDPWNMVQTSAGTALQIPVNGLYDLQAYGIWGANATGIRQITIRVNGAVLQTDRIAATSSGNPAHAVQQLGYPLNKGDLISAVVQQTSGGNLNLNSLSLTANYVGRRRSTTATELLTDGGFEANAIGYDTQWELFYATGTTTVDAAPNTSGTASIFSLKVVMPAGTASGAVTSNNLLPVYPGQIIRITGNVKSSAALAGTANSNVRFSLLCSASGTPNYFIADQTVDGALTATGTAFAAISQDITVPANCYVARVSLRYANTGGVTVWWDDISAKELIR